MSTTRSGRSSNTKKPNNGTSSRSGASRPSSSRSASKQNVNVVSRTGRGKRPASGGANKSGGSVHREIGGIALILVGIILGIFCYFGSSGLLASVAPVLFGLFGIAGYVLPVILIALGLLLILLPRSDLRPASIACIAAVFLAVIALIHVIAHGRSLVGARFFASLSNAYKLGAAHSGGGVFGGFFAYLFVLLLGVTGAIVALCGIILIAALLLTHFSIRGYLSDLREAHKTAAPERRRERRKLYNEELGGDDFAEHSGKPLTAGDVDQGYRRRQPQTAAKPVRDSAKRELLPMRPKSQKSDGDIEFFPLSGPIKTDKPAKKRGRKSELIESFDPPVYGGAKIADDDYTVYIPMNGGGPMSGAPAVEPPIDVPFKDEGLDDILSGVPIERYDDGADAPEPQKVPKKPPVKIEEPASIVPEDEEEPAVEPVYEYRFPPVELLKLSMHSSVSESQEEKARLLIKTMQDYGVSARIVGISVGPVITRFEIQPAVGVRINKVTTLTDEIAYALAAKSVRIEAPIPGKSAIGIEIPNDSTAQVFLRDIIDTQDFRNAKSPLTFALGKDIAGKVVLGDLAKMPHMLIAGQTGAGKSVCLNCIILSFVYKSAPKDLQMILIDPKQVELSSFDNLPHLFRPVVKDPKKAAGALRWACTEMDKRYSLMATLHAREIDRYNALQTDEADRLPRLVIIIDELADLMIVASKDVEESICRIAQLGRACGIHIIVATQRPSVDVITGLIKANIPSRIAFAVSNGTDSRVILDSTGAERLLGRGDMLFHPNGASKHIRAQGAFVSEEEVASIAKFFDDNPCTNQYFDDSDFSEVSSASGSAPAQGNGKQEDDLLPEAVRLVIESGAASISMIQRRLRVGYARAARLIDIMEQKGYVSRADGAKPRNVLISAAQYAEIFGGAPIAVPSGDYYEGDNYDDE